MNVRQAMCTITVLGLLAGVGHAATTLPYAQGFESGWSLGDPITASGGGTVAAHTNAVKTGAGAQGLILSNDTVTLDVQDSTYSNVWIQIYARPVKGASDPSGLDASVNGAFYITTNGQLKAYSGGSWTNVGAAQFSADTYYGFILHANYTTDTWDIYSTDGTYKTDMVKLNGAALAFSGSPKIHLDDVIIESGDRAYIDALAVSRAFDPAGSNTRVAVYEHASTNTAEAKFTLPAYAASYTNGANKTVGGQVGDHIRSGLINGDRLKVWSTTTAVGFGDHLVVLGAFDPASGTTTNVTTAEPIFTATALKLNQNDTRGDTFGFYPYSSTTVIALAGEIQPTASNSTETLVLNGTGSGAGLHPAGWTALNWSDTDNIDSLVFNDAANFTPNDDLFISDPASPNSWTWYRWNSTDNAWLRRTGASQPTIPPGANMWVKRSALTQANVINNFN